MQCNRIHAGEFEIFASKVQHDELVFLGLFLECVCLLENMVNRSWSYKKCFRKIEFEAYFNATRYGIDIFVQD